MRHGLPNGIFSRHSSCTAVPQKMMGKPSRNEFTNTNRANLKIFRDSSILSLSLSVFLSLLTCVVLVPLEDSSKHLGQFVERVFIHAIHPSKAEPEGAPRFLRSTMAQPISRLPLLLSATCSTAYVALMSPLCAGATKIWKELQNLEANGFKFLGPPGRPGSLEVTS